MISQMNEEITDPDSFRRVGISLTFSGSIKKGMFTKNAIKLEERILYLNHDAI